MCDQIKIWMNEVPVWNIVYYNQVFNINILILYIQYVAYISILWRDKYIFLFNT